MASNDDMTELLNAVGIANDKIAERSNVVQTIMAQQQQAADAQQEDSKVISNSTGIIKRAEGVAQMDAESKTRAAAVRLGTNPDDSSNILGTISDSWRQAAIDADKRLNDLDKKMQVKFLDSPLEFIKNKISFEDDVKAAEIAEKRRDGAAKTLQEAQANTQYAQTIHNALKSTVTDATLEASVAGAQAEIDQKAQDLRIKNGGVQINDLQVLGQLDVAGINNKVTVMGAKHQIKMEQNADAHLGLARKADARADAAQAANLESDKRQKEMFELTKAKMMRDAEDEKTELADRESIAQTVKQGAAGMGVTSIAVMPNSKVLQLLKMKDSHVMEYLNAGIQSQSRGTPTVADNAGDAARLVATTGAPLRPEQVTVKNFLNNVWQHSASPAGAREGQYDITKKDQVTSAAGRYAVVQATKMQTNIDPRDGSNIYAAPPLTSVAEVPGVKASKFYRAILDDQLKAQQLRDFNSEQLTAMTADAVKKGKISFNEAAVGLQGLHSSAVLLNNATKNYKGMGLPEQASFNIQMPDPLGFNRSFNMTSAQDVNRALMMKLKGAQPGTTVSAAQNPFNNN